MASSTKQFSLFLLLITLTLPLQSLDTHAREAQFFNKVSASSAANTVNPDDEQPKFLPQTDNSYGLYAYDSSQLPPSTTTAAAAAQPLHDDLPKNYVTVPEDISNFPNNPNNKFNYHYNGDGSSFNSRPRRQSDAGFRGGATYNSGGFRPQGMSDTRFLENGKYYYDINTEKYSSKHPYEYYNKNFDSNIQNAYEFNGDGYQTRDEFEDDQVINNLP